MTTELIGPTNLRSSRVVISAELCGNEFMLEVISLVNFNNPRRVAYLDRSFGSFYKFNPQVRHLVFDSSDSLALQSPFYARFGIEVNHLPGATYGERLKLAMSKIGSDYFLFLPDDFAWIMDFPLEKAISECRAYEIAELKLTARGMPWYAQPNAEPVPWFSGPTVSSGETLSHEGCLLVSRRRWFRDFHEQFSLACNLLQSEFMRSLVESISAKVRSPGEAEKQAYVRLLFRRYAVAYYKMWIPAFHFIDLSVEGDTPKNREKAATSLRVENFATYNRHYNI